MHLPFLLSTFVLAALVALSDSYAITGPQGGVNAATGQRPLRQEISSFQHAGPAFDLYLLAFQTFAQQDQTSLLSYYQVAGLSNLTSVSSIYLSCSQVSMGVRLSHGTASVGDMGRAIVPMGRSCFPPGIGLMWRSSKYVKLRLRKAHAMLKECSKFYGAMHNRSLRPTRPLSAHNIKLQLRLFECPTGTGLLTPQCPR